jgi:DNA-binding NarL/FixJ family response regulator
VIRVLLADDQDLVREGLRTIIHTQEDMEVIAEASNGKEAVRLARQHRPDVAVMDVRMPELDGIQATRQLTRGDGPRVLVLTTFDLDEYVYEAMRAGATGFALKSAPRHQLLAAIRAAADGDVLLAPAVTRRLIERFVADTPGTEPPAALARLSAREAEVLRLVARGLSNAELAAELHLAETTVKTHVSAVLTKLGLRDRVQAVVYAYEHGLIRRRDSSKDSG